jgi:hypothetical protein
MPTQKSLSACAPRRAAASDPGNRHKGNGHAQLSRSDLEHMLFEAARMRATNAYRPDRLVKAFPPRRKQFE